MREITTKPGPAPGGAARPTRTLALAGNPNVGKSTVFNGLTGLRQHTGNWPGKTVSTARGLCAGAEHDFELVDVPGAYSLLAHSAEEEVARNFICFGQHHGVVLVCDATCLERNLNLVLQTLEAGPPVLVCVNLLDEAKRKGIHIDLEGLSQALGAPVVGVVARDKQGLEQLAEAMERLTPTPAAPPLRLTYPAPVERALELLQPMVSQLLAGLEPGLDPRWLSLRLLDGDEALEQEIAAYFRRRHNLPHILEEPRLKEARRMALARLRQEGVAPGRLSDLVVSALVLHAENICAQVVKYEKKEYNARDRAWDRVLTGRPFAYPLMLLLLALIFWITISGANYPSQLLSQALFWFQDCLTDLFQVLGAPDWLHGLLVLGLYRVLAWVVSVMLPPMAIFFPLFTLLEDAGYLPRVAYNLDKPFQKCRACGKQALTMCMGFGCNAAAIVGCRIIDSPRERMLAILTNNFVPCNGRFPTLIALLTMFFINNGGAGGPASSLLPALLLTGVILLGVLITLAVTRLLSATLLRGLPSSFALEMPPFRRPQLGRVVVRSILDRTLFVLGRAVTVAAPAGMVIWLLANITAGPQQLSLLGHCAAFLDPAARLLGLDGVILLAFILGFPANEIVVPIIIMAYLAQGSILELDSLAQLRQLLVDNGWTLLTAVNTILFSLLHWPCSTTLLTIKKETASWKWTLAAAAIPTALGLLVCLTTTALARWLG